MELVRQITTDRGFTYTGPSSEAVLDIGITYGTPEDEAIDQIQATIEDKCAEYDAVLLRTKVYYVSDEIDGMRYYVKFYTIGTTMGLIEPITIAAIIAALLIIAFIAWCIQDSVRTVTYGAGGTSPLLFGAIAIGILAISAGYIYDKFFKEPKKFYVPEVARSSSIPGVEDIRW